MLFPVSALCHRGCESRARSGRAHTQRGSAETRSASSLAVTITTVHVRIRAWNSLACNYLPIKHSPESATRASSLLVSSSTSCFPSTIANRPRVASLSPQRAAPNKRHTRLTTFFFTPSAQIAQNVQAPKRGRALLRVVRWRRQSAWPDSHKSRFLTQQHPCVRACARGN